MEVEVNCPYCGETISVWVDAGGGAAQRYVEDCSVCCCLIELSVFQDENGELEVGVACTDE